MKNAFGKPHLSFKAQTNRFAQHEAGFKTDKVGNGSYLLDPVNLHPLKAKPAPKVGKMKKTDDGC